MSATLANDLRRLVGRWPMRRRSRDTLRDHGKQGSPAAEARAIRGSTVVPHTARGTAETPKTCFVVFPAGTLASKTRIRSDQVLQHIIMPAVQNQGYDELVRSDDLPNSELMTQRLIEHLVGATLVIADLTEADPRVFYGLAVRHASRKPAIHIVAEGGMLPFDITQSRVIQFDLRSKESIENGREQMERQIVMIEEDQTRAYNPISTVIDLLNWQQSDNRVLQSQGEILSLVQGLTESVHAALRRKQMRLSAAEFNGTLAHLAAIRVALAERASAGLTRADLGWIDRMIGIVETDLYGISQELNLQVPSPASTHEHMLPE